MKKVFAVTLAFLLLLTACGGKTASEPVDLAALYAEFENTLPEMMQLDETVMLNFLGIDSADCAQVIAAICTDGMKTDEVWLVEAVDEAALQRVKTLAETRLKAKTEETISYAPDQYAVVEKAQLLTRGNYLALIVTAESAALASVWEAAVK